MTIQKSQNRTQTLVRVAFWGTTTLAGLALAACYFI